jgi:hypothetical protein
MKHRFQVNSFEVKTLAVPQSETRTTNKGRTPRPAGTGAAITLERLRDCVYGVAARNFSDGKARRNRLADRIKRHVHIRCLTVKIGARTGGAYGSIYVISCVLSERHQKK